MRGVTGISKREQKVGPRGKDQRRKKTEVIMEPELSKNFLNN